MLNAGELANRLKRIESLLALAMSRSAGGAGSGTISSFLWQPGGVAGENVFTTWAALAAVLAATKGEKSVAIDTTIAAAHVTTGAWAGITDVTFVAAGAVPVETVVNIDDGATFTSTHRLVFDGIEVEWAGTTVPLISQGGAGFVYIGLENLAEVVQTGGQPVVALSGTATLIAIARTEGAWGVGTIQLGVAGVTADLFQFDGSTLASGAVIGGAGTLNVVLDGASQPVVSATQSPAPVIEVLDPQPTFVFRPGATGTLDGNVFTTWAGLMAAAALTAGPITLLIDDSLAAAHATAGAWNIDNFMFRSERRTQTATLHIDEGAVFTVSRFELLDSLVFQSEATATVPFPSATATNKAIRIYTRNNAVFKSTTAVAMFQQSAGGSVTFVCDEGTAVGDGAHPVITTDAGQTSSFQLFAKSAVTAHALAGAGTTIVTKDSSVSVNATQDVTTLTTVLADNASLVAYTPATGANWNPVPTVIGSAVDQVAASNSVSATGNTGTGTGTVTVTTGNVTKAKNGQMVVRATCMLSSSAPTTVTLQLKRDAGNIGTPKSVVAAAAINAMDCAIEFVDTAPDNAAHTYTLSVSASAGNLTVAANSAQIVVVEDS